MFTYAIARKPGENFAQGITSSDLGEPDYERIVEQHAAYLKTLETLGLHIVLLDALPHYPDAYFVEDTAVVTPDVAVITRPGASARNGEQDSIEPVLAEFRKTPRIEPPGTVDGGDVLMAERHFFIGISERTNKEGAEQLGSLLQKFGNTWEAVPVGAGLHLKSGVNYIGNHTLLLTEDFRSFEGFRGYEKIVLPDDEAYAANTLWVNGFLVTPKGFPVTRERLTTAGFEVLELDVSEVRKMDGGLTCMSIRF